MDTLIRGSEGRKIFVTDDDVAEQFNFEKIPGLVDDSSRAFHRYQRESAGN